LQENAVDVTRHTCDIDLHCIGDCCSL